MVTQRFLDAGGRRGRHEPAPHLFPVITSSPQSDQRTPLPEVPERVTLYHWLVIAIASAGWLFDCMDQRIFNLSREPALREILGPGTPEAIVRNWGGWATSMMMVGWATGGIIFGMTSDRLGRVKTMMITLLVYSGFTGLSGIAHSVPAFLLYRFLVGLGVGGMFGAATTLVAESVPPRIRAVALGSLQALSACGNIIGSLLSTQIQPGKADFLFGMSGWRIIFFVGVLPAILIVPIMLVLREPERWKEAKARPCPPARGRHRRKDSAGKPGYGTNPGLNRCASIYPSRFWRGPWLPSSVRVRAARA